MTTNPEKRTVRIPLGDKIGPDRQPIYGWQDVTAYCINGLCVHRSTPGYRHKWTVTHEASGLTLERIGARTKARAMENMRAAVALDFDWTLPERETQNALRESRNVMDEINRIAETTE